MKLTYYNILFVWLLFVITNIAHAQIVIPDSQHVAWHELEYYWFLHFGPNTFTDVEWGHGTENEKIFNPKKLDANQWARIAKQAGAKGLIITAKHHDGFCLWPSKYSTHTVHESEWKKGKGDVVRELADACKKYGLKFGVYISPWDRNHPKYGTDEYNDVYIKMMTEILTNYGDLFELWWDGANGEGPNGKKQVYDFHRFEQVALSLQPKVIIFSDVGPGIRWCGNEDGSLGETNWNTFDTTGYGRGATGPPQKMLNTGVEEGPLWIPAEADVSIRPGWFYHSNENEKVKTPQQLFEIYYKTVGRGGNLLLNVPPDTNGLITSYDSLAAMGLKEMVDKAFEKNLASDAFVKVLPAATYSSPQKIIDGKRETFYLPNDSANKLSVELIFKTPVEFNNIILQEYIERGQRIKAFTIEAWNGKSYTEISSGTTIGYKRIIPFAKQTTNKVRINFTSRINSPLISEIQLYNSPYNVNLK